MKKLLLLLLLFSSLASAEVHQADTCISCNFINPIGVASGSGTSTGTNTGDQSDDTLPVLSIGFSPTAYLRSVQNDIGSAGWIEDFLITDAGSETVDIAAGEFRIRDAATATSPLYYVSVAATTGASVPTDATRYLIGDYNAGSPIATLQTSDTSDGYIKIYLGEVHNIGGALSIHNDPRPIGDISNRSMDAWMNVIGTRVTAGEVTSDPSAPSRKVAVSAGTIYNGRDYSPITTPTVDTSGAGTFTAIYGSFTYVTAQTDWDNAQYDNAGTLTAMTAGFYGNHYVIRGFNGEISLLYGRAEYATQSAAEAEATPTPLPEEYVEHGVVDAKITFLKGAASPASITDLRPVIGSSAATALSPTSHNGLTDIQGGVGGQYYHLTSSEYTGTGSGVFVRQSALTAPRVNSAASAASITPDIDAYDVYQLTAQAAGLTINAPTGTPANGQLLEFIIKDNATSQTLTFNAVFVPYGAALPAATTISKTILLMAQWNSSTSKWMMFPSVEEQ